MSVVKEYDFQKLCKVDLFMVWDMFVFVWLQEMKNKCRIQNFLQIPKFYSKFPILFQISIFSPQISKFFQSIQIISKFFPNIQNCF